MPPSVVSDLAARAAAIAAQARSREDARGTTKPVAVSEPGQPGPQPERSHWYVYKPGIREPFTVTVYPPQTQRDMVTIVYPGCGAIPRDGQ